MMMLNQHQDDVLVLRMSGQEVRIYIQRIRGNTVRLAVDAPREVEIQRLPSAVPEPEPLPEPVIVRRPRTRRR